MSLARSLIVVFLAPILALAAGCAVRMDRPVAAVQAAVAPEAAAAAMPRPLDKSLFARDPGGQLTEEALQKVLASPVELALPARVGVLPIVPAADWRGPGPSYAIAAGAGVLARGLAGTEQFPMVTEVMPIPSGALGMEALREIAARYKLRYLLLYRENFARHRRANGWSALYATVIGAFFMPGQTLAAHGWVEASLFDVKTGLFLYTVRRGTADRRKSNVWHQDDKLDELVSRLAGDAAGGLVRDIREATLRYAEAVKIEEGRRLAAAPAPVAAGNAALQQ